MPSWKHNVCLIAAVGHNGALGLDGNLPWHDGEDLKFFRRTTLGHVVLVGWRTAQTLPPLPGRTVVTDNRAIPPDKFLAQVHEMYPDKTIFIAGGAKTYERYRGLIRRSLITHIDYNGVADTRMAALW